MEAKILKGIPNQSGMVTKNQTHICLERELNPGRLDESDCNNHCASQTASTSTYQFICWDNSKLGP
ncbi:hypothetical protein DPMN_139887 [Dreissena polymorpha]|uniref:Uncharacterized protein n=1 Tax=Dreissena polymorpha TaxID=45954 RepID=A0A9D4JL77_DREPO|nr:hypothetical protein DPMN_139834 [Dreissena polymorpha]KAH3811477.1 hypothetical protein DPMN_139887 [Dreissena polymorpha]